VQVIARALGFLEPAPPGGVVAVLYTDPASKSDADAVAALFSSGVASRQGPITAKAVDPASLGDGAGFIAVMVAAGAKSDAAAAAAVARHLPCIAATALVEAGRCTLSVSSDPRIAIVVNHQAAQAAGVSFASAFRMMVREI
jgi:hypothetical protein